MWLPGFERWEIPGRPGVPYDEYDDPKAMVHTTEGGSIAGAVSAYRDYPPQLIVDPWVKRKVQHISLANAGYALWNEDVDDSRCVQIEIVGYASQTHTWSDEVYRWLGEEVARPLHEHFGVPYVAVWKGFKGERDVNYTLASADSPLRLTQWEIDHFSGWLAHQHSPGDTHWDAGGFKCDLMLSYAKGSSKKEMIDLSGFDGYAMQVQDGPITKDDNIPKGSAWLYSATSDTLHYFPAAALEKACKDAGVMHIGVSGDHVLQVLNGIRDRRAAEKAAAQQS